MYRVLLVEDEPPILRAEKAAIEGAASDFLVVKCAENGKEAVAALENDAYDIVFTDIKMPTMDGLKLAEWIHTNRPDTMVILLSGYSDFKYARTALQCKVFDYVLKPVSKAKLQKLCERIREELGGGAANARLPEQKSGDRSCLIMLACAGAYLLHGSEVLLPGEDFWSGEQIEQLFHGLLREGETRWFFSAGFPCERYIIIESDSKEREEEIAAAFFEAFREKELPVTVVYKAGVKFAETGSVLTPLREQLIRSLILGRSQLICEAKRPETYGSIERPYSKDDIDAIVLLIKNGSRNGLHDKLKSSLEILFDIDSTQEEINDFLNLILESYALTYPKSIQRKITSVKHEFVNALAAYVSFDAFLYDIVSILMTLRCDVKNSDKYEKLADSVEAYLIKNYTLTITSKVIAKEFGFVPSYISRIFKRNKGLSPNEFLIKLRITRARQLISENPEMKIKEVANLVGFNESYYFSKTFKRETGMWPSECNKTAPGENIL